LSGLHVHGICRNHSWSSFITNWEPEGTVNTNSHSDTSWVFGSRDKAVLLVLPLSTVWLKKVTSFFQMGTCKLRGFNLVISKIPSVLTFYTTPQGIARSFMPFPPPTLSWDFWKGWERREWNEEWLTDSWEGSDLPCSQGLRSLF
jgi:hypothetical protein